MSEVFIPNVPSDLRKMVCMNSLGDGCCVSTDEMYCFLIAAANCTFCALSRSGADRCGGCGGCEGCGGWVCEGGCMGGACSGGRDSTNGGGGGSNKATWFNDVDGEKMAAVVVLVVAGVLVVLVVAAATTACIGEEVSGGEDLGVLLDGEGGV